MGESGTGRAAPGAPPAGVRPGSSRHSEAPDTGSLRSDMIGLLRRINATRAHLATIMSIQMAA
ncbi:hypothetical protein [Streptodolium elevatio]